MTERSGKPLILLDRGSENAEVGLKDRYKVREVRLFGSFGRGEQTEESDLDVLVGFDEPVSLLDLAALEVFLNDLLGIRVDVVPQEDLREELRGYILKEALPL